MGYLESVHFWEQKFVVRKFQMTAAETGQCYYYRRHYTYIGFSRIAVLI